MSGRNCSGEAMSSIGVRITPGWIELTRIFSGAYWIAAVLVRRRTAPLVP